MAKRYLDPKADLTFKRVFGEHKNLLMSLLNSLLPLPEGCPIVEIEYQSPELVPDVPTKKDSIVDVRCVDSLGRSFAVEMQMYWTTAFKHRALLNTAKAYTRQLDAGGQFAKIQPVYTLSFVNDLAFPGDEEFYHRYLPTDSVNPANTIDGFEMIFIELPKFANWQKQHGGDASVYSADGSVTISRHTLNRLAVLWCRFLTEINEHTLEVDSALLADEEVGTALGIVEQSAFTDGEMYYYERYWDTVSRERTALEEAAARGAARGWEEGINRGREEGLAAGREEGLAAGLAEGKARGREEGLAAGREEGLAAGREEGLAAGREEGLAAGREEGLAAGRAEEKKKLALNLLSMGMPVETVVQATELSYEEIKNLTK